MSLKSLFARKPEPTPTPYTKIDNVTYYLMTCEELDQHPSLIKKMDRLLHSQGIATYDGFLFGGYHVNKNTINIIGVNDQDKAVSYGEIYSNTQNNISEILWIVAYKAKKNEPVNFKNLKPLIDLLLEGAHLHGIDTLYAKLYDKSWGRIKDPIALIKRYGIPCYSAKGEHKDLGCDYDCKIDVKEYFAKKDASLDGAENE